MSAHPFWYVDDEQRVRWAVRVARPWPGLPALVRIEPRIVFTSRDRQISTACPSGEEELRLSRRELLVLLARAKREAAIGPPHLPQHPSAAN